MFAGSTAEKTLDTYNALIAFAQFVRSGDGKCRERAEVIVALTNLRDLYGAMVPHLAINRREFKSHRFSLAGTTGGVVVSLVGDRSLSMLMRENAITILHTTQPDTKR